MKRIIVASVLVFAPFVAFAGGHSALGGSGTGVRIDLKSIEGTSGSHVQVTTSDIWMYDNPPEGFPEAMQVNCNYFQVLHYQQQPNGGIGVYAYDPDGDISLSNGVFQPDGTIAVTIVAGTGKLTAQLELSFKAKLLLFRWWCCLRFKPVN